MPHALHIFSTFAPAGPELRAVELMANLGNGYRHTIVAMDDCLEAARRIPESVDYRILTGPGTKQTSQVLRWTWKLLNDEAPNLLLTYNWGAFDAVLAARLKRFPRHIHHEDGFNIDEAKGEIARRKFLRRLCLPRVQHLIVPSARLENLASQSWRVPAKKLSLIPNGVNTSLFCPQPRAVRREVREDLGIPSDARVVGSVAGYRQVKRLDRLIRTCANLTPDPTGRETHLLLIGDGPERPTLETLATQHLPPGGKVHLLGFRSDLPRIYAALDVFALTSASEQQPISLLEAMACGLPAVCTDVGDIRTTLGEGGEGTLIDSEGPNLEQEFTSALDRLIQSPSLCQTRGEQARQRVMQAYSLDAMVQRYEEIYGQAQ